MHACRQCTFFHWRKKKKTLEAICETTFASIGWHEASVFAARMKHKIQHLPALPTGAGDWLERHKAAVVAGSAGLLILGPGGAIAGVVGGEVLHDRGRRENGTA